MNTNMTQYFNTINRKQIRKILRNNPTTAEKVLWFNLRKGQINGYRFRRQFSIDRFVVDFYCPKLRLIIEVDGEYHHQSNIMFNDVQRQKILENLGLYVLRFENKDILENVKFVVKQINIFINNTLPLAKGEGQGGGQYAS